MQIPRRKTREAMNILDGKLIWFKLFRLCFLISNTKKEEHFILIEIIHCNFLRYHFQPFSLNLVLPSVVKPSGARHRAPNLT